MDRTVGHGPESSIGSRRSDGAGYASAPMDALILADGDAPTRDGLDAAWPGWDAGVDLVIAADGGARLRRSPSA